MYVEHKYMQQQYRYITILHIRQWCIMVFTASGLDHLRV